MRRCQTSRQLQECEWVPAGLDDDPFEHALIEPTWQGGFQQRTRITMTQRLDAKLRETRERVTMLARGEHERDLFGQQAAGDERKHPRRRGIEPLRVVDDAEQRPRLGRLRQQVEDRQPDKEGIRDLAGTESERDRKCMTLRIGEWLHELESRCAQLLNRRVGQLHLALDAGGAGDPKPIRCLDRVPEQCRLADARLAAHDQGSSVTAARAVQQPVKHLPLTVPAK